MTEKEQMKIGLKIIEESEDLLAALAVYSEWKKLTGRDLSYERCRDIVDIKKFMKEND